MLSQRATNTSLSPHPQRLADFSPSRPPAYRPLLCDAPQPIHSVASKSRVFQSTEPTPFLSIVPSARYISLSRGHAPAAHLEPQRPRPRLRPAPVTCIRASSTFEHSHCTAAHHHHYLTTTTTLITKALPAAPSPATTSSTSPSSSRRILHPQPVPLCSE